MPGPTATGPASDGSSAAKPLARSSATKRILLSGQRRRPWCSLRTGRLLDRRAVNPETAGPVLAAADRGVRRQRSSQWTSNGPIAEHSERQFPRQGWDGDSARVGWGGCLNGFGLSLRFDRAITRFEGDASSSGDRHGRDPVQPGPHDDQRRNRSSCNAPESDSWLTGSST